MSCPEKFIPTEYNETVYQAFLEGDDHGMGPVEIVLQECALQKSKNIHDDFGFTIKIPLGGYKDLHNGVDLRAIVLVCARSRHTSFKPKHPHVYRDIADNE